MQRQPLVKYLLTDGIQTSGVQSAERPTMMAKGSKNVLMTGYDKPNAFRGMTELAGKSGSRIMMPVGSSYGGLGAFGESGVKGSITRMLAAMLFSGTGALYYDGVSLSASASSILQLKVLQSGGWSATFQAGLTVPSSPILAALSTLGAGFTGRLKNGTYSAKIYKIRSATGARSNASETSNIIITSDVGGIGQSARVTFPAIGGNGADAWGLCVSPKGFGSSGPHFLLKEIMESELTTIDGVPRSIEIEWTDGDLVGSILAPVDSNPPPACVFNGGLGDAFFIDGCYGDLVSGVSAAAPGATIVVSLTGRPEEFPADNLLFPPEPPTAMIRGGEGFYYRFGRNSLGVISYTGGSPPLAFQLYWATIGIDYPHNACVAEGGRLYAKTGQRGVCRIAAGGDIDASFANEIIDEFGSWADIDTVLGWDENSQNVCFINNLTVWAFNSSQGKWGNADLTGKVSGKVISAVTDGGNLYLACEDAANAGIKIYKFNSGTGSVIEQRTDWHFAQEATDSLRQMDITMRSDTLNPVEVQIFANENDVTPAIIRTITPKKTGLVKLPPLLLSTQNYQSYAVHLKQTSAGGDSAIESVLIEGVSRAILR